MNPLDPTDLLDLHKSIQRPVAMLMKNYTVVSAEEAARGKPAEIQIRVSSETAPLSIADKLYETAADLPGGPWKVALTYTPGTESERFAVITLTGEAKKPKAEPTLEPVAAPTPDPE